METKRNSISGGNVPLREPSTGIYNALDEVEVELFPEIEVEVLEFELI